MKEAMENSATSTETTSEEPVATSPEQVVEEIASGKPNDQMPEETDVDEDWDKD
jgi:hypothetical protein